MKKRALCILLALLLTISLLPIPASAAGGVKINKTNFPDSKFRSFIKMAYDTDGNGTLSTAEIDAATALYLGSESIASLKGVEFLTELIELNCYDNKLTSLDLSKNTRLKYLDCSFNQLKTHDISKNTRLEIMDCSANQLKTLDVSKNTKLTSMMCSHNKLTALDVSQNTKLEEMDCGGNQLQKLDITKNPDLAYLTCYPGKISKLNISANPRLIRAYNMGSKYNGEYIQYTDGYSASLRVDYSTVISGYKPAIKTQPKDVYVSAGNAATFAVDVKGEDLEYQWYRMWEDGNEWYPISGETGSVLVIHTSKYDTVGFRVYCGITLHGARETLAVTSDPAKLTFVKKPVITTQPKNAGVAAGKTVSFKLKATGGGLKYQWYVQKKGASTWTKLSGKTSATLKLTAKKTMNGYKYRCEVKNDAAKITSKTVKLTVK